MGWAETVFLPPPKTVHPFGTRNALCPFASGAPRSGARKWVIWSFGLRPIPIAHRLTMQASTGHRRLNFDYRPALTRVVPT